MGNQNRMSRELESRENDIRDQPWEPPSSIPTPDPQDGYAFRWVRVSTMGLDDARNVSMRRREGWEPVKAEDHPELLLDLGLYDGSAPKNGLVLFGGLMLCKNLEEKVEKRNGYYENMADQQMRSVDNNFMRESDVRMPLFSDKRAEVTFGRGK